MIKPTVGRVLWYFPTGEDKINRTIDAQPLAAIIAHVNADGRVNLAIFDSTGRPFHRTSVPLVQDEGEGPSDGDYCRWMPYQLGQAAKTAALEKKYGRASEDIRAATQSDPAFDNLPRG
jgi:hypothetical protein